VIKDLDSKIKGTVWKVVKFAVGVCKSQLNLALILWISEFNSYKPLFWQQIIEGKKYIVILMVEFLDSWIGDDKNLYFWHS